MTWEKPSDAKNLAEHCSKYAIHQEEISNVELENSGNALVVSRAEYRGRLVVLKRWHGAFVPHESRVLFTKRLTRDLERWRALKHQNIAPILGVVLHISNLPALVVPHYRTVAQALGESPHIDVFGLMQGVAAGLSYLHAQHPPITHGDLKGSSVFLSPSGTALLSDIGIATIPQPPDWGFHGVDDARWLAPELMDPALRPEADGEGIAVRTPDGRLPVTLESDMYSFGMLAYEMYTRARPFSSIPWPAAVIVRIVAGKRPPRPTREQSPQLSNAVWDLIQLCWTHDYRDRLCIGTVVAWLGVLACMRTVEG
ncbi:kinase-like domain-containing protein [Mycena capillaripes]|nr:kinase-like domain-containing protein [Mycena capillaripes]